MVVMLVCPRETKSRDEGGADCSRGDEMSVIKITIKKGRRMLVIL